MAQIGYARQTQVSSEQRHFAQCGDWPPKPEKFGYSTPRSESRLSSLGVGGCETEAQSERAQQCDRRHYRKRHRESLLLLPSISSRLLIHVSIYTIFSTHPTHALVCSTQLRHYLAIRYAFLVSPSATGCIFDIFDME